MSAVIVMNNGGGPVVGSIISTAAAPVDLSNQDNTGVFGWEWELTDKPTGSGAVLSSTTSDTPQITPDVPGTYMIKLRTFKDAARTLIDDADFQAIGIRMGVAGPIAEPMDWRFPGAGETTQFDGTKGWKTEVNDNILREIRERLPERLAYFGGQTTANATPKSLLIIPTATDVSYIMEVWCIGTRDDGADVLHYAKRFSVKNDGGVVSFVGVEDIVYEKRSGSATWDLTKAIVSTSIQVIVTGEAAKNIRWRGVAIVMLQSGVN